MSTVIKSGLLALVVVLHPDIQAATLFTEGSTDVGQLTGTSKSLILFPFD